MSGVHTHSTMRPSLQAIGRMSFRALKAPVFSALAAASKPQHRPRLCSSISSFGVTRRICDSQILSASARRSLLCASSRLVTAAAATAAPAVADIPAAQQQATSSSDGTGRNDSAPTFQEAIKRLQDYWAAAGCVVWLPHNTEVGAGTMNPATFLRVLGPEPWNVCYAEPSIRPDDSRYGDNPNRVQRHTQFQVILKPDPGNAQELYLGSLEALGIDTSAHDVRYVVRVLMLGWLVLSFMLY
eukprot:GHUV01026718.1.p1 GENE.GHUV01026718.1~~GHUV01026718.1.p1  ORF type:complete len:277 (+),score=74.84 GHUV01026718.1:108-833(+)